MNNTFLYLFGFVLALTIAFMLCPFFRMIAIRYHIMDHPNALLKAHASSTPYLGGAGIGIAFILSLLIVFMLSSFRISLNHAWVAVFCGGLIIFILGLVDDSIKDGLSFKTKFVVQFMASIILLFFGLEIQLTQPHWLIYPLAIFWVIGIMNAINIIDIMDGLAGSAIVIVSLGFLFISLPMESIYIQLSAAILAGATLGFLPYNFSKKKKMFMGDTGSLLAGYVLGVLSLGTHYPNQHANIIAPILILGVPIFDTFFVIFIRYRKGISPFRGSKDHFALRLEKMGFARATILFITAAASIFLCCVAWFITQIGLYDSFIICILILILSYLTGAWLAKVKI